MYLSIDQLTKSFGDGASRRTILDRLCFGVERGSFCVFLGPSGSGKLTLLNIIGGIETPDSGEVRIAGEARRSWRASSPTIKKK